MPLTTVAQGRVYEWSHAVGRGAQSGTGFNYPQTMCLAKGGVAFVANRGNENNFGMRVNEVKIGGPGEEELLAEFFQWGEGDGRSTWPFGVAVDAQDHVYVSDEWHNTISVFDSSGKFLRKWGKAGSGDGELSHPAGLVCEKNGNLIVVDSGNNRLQVFSGDGKFVAKCGKGGSGDGEFNQPLGVTLDQAGNIYVADWKNHRVQKLSPQGKFMMKIGQYGTVPVSPGPSRSPTWGRTCRPRARPAIPRPACSIIPPTSPWIPTAISTSPTGATIGSASSTLREAPSPTSSAMPR